MMEELAARFLPQFIALARTRLQAATTAVTGGDHAADPVMERELHALAGEAGLLGLRDLIPVARDCEQKARVLRASHKAADADALLVALRELGRMIDGIAAAKLP